MAGTNGEAATLTRDEKAQLIRLTREVAAQGNRADLPITVGCNGFSTQAVIADTKAAHEAGADFVLVLTPSFFHFAMNEDAVIDFFTEASSDINHITHFLFLHTCFEKNTSDEFISM